MSKLPQQRISLITLGVADLDRSKAFYNELGWTLAPRGGDNIAFYQLHGFVLGLFGHAALAKDQDRAPDQLGTGAMTLAINMPDEAEVDAFFDLALNAGATVIKSPTTADWGGHSGYFADPDGHVWEVAFNPYWSLNEDGTLTLKPDD